MLLQLPSIEGFVAAAPIPRETSLVRPCARSRTKMSEVLSRSELLTFEASDWNATQCGGRLPSPSRTRPSSDGFVDGPLAWPPLLVRLTGRSVPPAARKPRGRSKTRTPATPLL